MKHEANNNIEDIEGEIWEKVNDVPSSYNGIVYASNYGRIKRSGIIFKNIPSKQKKYVTNRGRKNEYICTQHTSVEGYLKVNLFGKSISVHRLVAIAFYGKNESLVVNHIDCNKSNNTLQNLEWCTKKQNSIHAWNNGLVNLEKAREANKGEANHFSKLNIYRVRVIRKLEDRIFTNSRLANLYGVSRKALSNARKGITWKSVL